jgi:hypothetical protein
LRDDICRDRVGPPTLYMKNERQRVREASLQKILSGGGK